MKNKRIGCEINIPEDSKVVYIPMSEEMNEYFKTQNEKNYIFYLKKFIGGEKNYEIAFDAVKDCMKKALPKDRKEKCKFCLGFSDDKGDKLCEKYNAQMMFTYFVAGNEFLRIVFRNKFLLTNKVVLQKLTINFFDCLHFIEGQGKMYFDLDKMCRYCLHAGFLSLSEMFAKSSDLNNIRVINNTLNEIDSGIIENKVLQKEDDNYLELQKEFFDSKLCYYKNKLFIEEKEDKSEISSGNSKKERRVSIPQYALYYYYLQQSGDFGFFENHPEGKVNAIKELIEKEELKTTPKYFQKVYNKIAHYKTNRVARNQISNIDFVINVMLKDFDEAKKIAIQELKEAKTKNR
ncbi:hypothetical protein [Pseudofulvibacter geojedonensis]|uniref:Uncharacterized protein n=1 Tax=Pseudofulvibacter geojedonensis TaxID=1123758 RepID=A0ABW3I1U1_9FLAO